MSAVFTGTVGVTGVNATDNPGPGVAVAQSLRSDPRFQGRIVGLAYDVLDPGLYMEGLLDDAYLIPYPSVGRGALFARLAHIKERSGLDVLLPNLDSELPSLLDQEEALGSLGIQTFLPSRRAHDARAKEHLHQLALHHGLPVPASTTLVDVGPLLTWDRFPVVIKSPFYGATVCHSVDEALRAFHKAAAKWGLPIIAQRFVQGEEVNVAALGDRGATLAAVPMRKLLLTDSGKGWAGVTLADPALLQLAEAVIKALAWSGPCEIELVREPDGTLWILEINPRMPAWIDLTAGAGANIPLLTTLLASGQAVAPQRTYVVGKAFVRISTNQIVDIADLDAITTSGELHHGQHQSNL